MVNCCTGNSGAPPNANGAVSSFPILELMSIKSRIGVAFKAVELAELV